MKSSIVGEPEDFGPDHDPEHQLEHDDRRREPFRDDGDGDRGERGDHDDREEGAGVDLDLGYRQRVNPDNPTSGG